MFIMFCFITCLFFPYILCTFFAFETIKFKSSAYKKTGVKGTESDCDGEWGCLRSHQASPWMFISAELRRKGKLQSTGPREEPRGIRRGGQRPCHNDLGSSRNTEAGEPGAQGLKALDKGKKGGGPRRKHRT